ncbi:MAG: fumarylacetoacetate hydrolase family protein [Ginsengibacter sp.]
MKILCIGRNYVNHAKELGNEVPEEPVIFMKPESALSINDAPFIYPSFSKDLHYEAELVIKINKDGKNISEENATEFYDEMTIGIDFTARDIQQQLKKKSLPWEKAKAFDGSAAVGRFIHIAPEMKMDNINFSFLKNNETVQQGNSKMMIFSINQIIANISQYFTLNAGDLIFTGTPEGVGECVTGDSLNGFIENELLLSIIVK